MLILSGYIERQTNQSDLHPSIERLMFDQPLTKDTISWSVALNTWIIHVLSTPVGCCDYITVIKSNKADSNRRGRHASQVWSRTAQTPAPQILQGQNQNLYMKSAFFVQQTNESSAQLTHYLHPHGFTHIILFVRAKKEATCRSRPG